MGLFYTCSRGDLTSREEGARGPPGKARLVSGSGVCLVNLSEEASVWPVWRRQCWGTASEGCQEGRVCRIMQATVRPGAFPWSQPGSPRRF